MVIFDNHAHDRCRLRRTRAQQKPGNELADCRQAADAKHDQHKQVSQLTGGACRCDEHGRSYRAGGR